jgi:ssDNA-binding replication factor A large subunit
MSNLTPIDSVLDSENRIDVVSLQVSEITHIGDQYILILTDRVHFIEGNLSQAYYPLIEKNQLVENQVVLISDYSVMENSGRYEVNLNTVELGEVIPKPPVTKPITSKTQQKRKSEALVNVSTLSTFNEEWTLRAKVLCKHGLKEYKARNSQSSRNLFSLSLLDSCNTRITATLFGEPADRYYTEIVEGFVYLFSNGKVTIADPKYRLPDSIYKIEFYGNCRIILDQDQSWLREPKNDFLADFSKIPDLVEKAMIDVCGLVYNIEDTTEQVSKKGTEYKKRVLKCVDTSFAAVDIVLWNDFAVDPRIDRLQVGVSVILAKNVLVSHFNSSISLNTSRKKY